MRAFVALARTGTFTLAAQTLHVTQSALSGLIKELEQTLDARVVDRSTRRIGLTEIGRELLPLFSQIIDDLDGALANVADHTRLKKGVVRIAAPHVGIGPERTPAPPLLARELFTMPFALVFPHQHPLAALERVTWQDAAAYPFISLQGQFTDLLLDAVQPTGTGIALTPAHEVTFMTTALAMVSAGLGVTVCLPYAEPLATLYGLTMRPLDAPSVQRRFFVYTRLGRSLSPAVESYLEFLFAYVKRSQGEG